MELVKSPKNTVRYPIDLRKSKKLFLDFVQKHNQGKQLRSKEFLKQPVQFTFSRLMYILSQTYLEPTTHRFLLKQNINGYLNAQDIAVTDTKSYIANLDQRKGQEFKLMSNDTVKRHLKKLELFGAIKIVKGVNRNWILIHPELIEFTSNFTHLSEHFAPFFKYSLNLRNTENQALQEQKNANCTPKYPYKETINNIIVSNVDNSTSHNRNLECDKETLNKETPETEKVEFTSVNKETKKEKVPQKRKKGFSEEYKEYKKAKNQSKKQRSQAEIRKNYIQNSINFLWSWISTNLYSQYEYLAQSQEQYFKTYMLNTYESTGKSHEEVYDHVFDRLELWRDWVNKDNEFRFTPLPSSFFKISNHNGFIQTRKWRLNLNKRKIETEVRRKASNCFRKFVSINELKGKYANLTQDQQKAELKKLTYAMSLEKKRHPEVFKQYEERISRYLTHDKFNWVA